MRAASAALSTRSRKISSSVVVAVPALRPQFCQRALGDQPAGGDDADALGHALGDFEDVGGHDDRAARRDALEQHVLHLPRGAGIEAGQRLVQDDQLRIVHERAGERHLLAHALGKAFAAFVGVRVSPSQPISSCARCSAMAGVDRPEAGDELEIFERR